MQDVMVDTETWGTRPGSMLRSLGAVFFDLETGQLGDEFYATITEKSCKALKMQKDPGTIEWWAKPENALANKQLAEGQQSIMDVFQKFDEFWKRGRGMHFWSQGLNFDDPLMSWVYHALGREQPWAFYRGQDTRTVYRIAGFNNHTVKRAGTYHNALDDAKHQVVCVSMAHRKLRGKLV